MPDTSAKDDIADLMKRLTEPVAQGFDAVPSPVVRLVVATDWTDASVPLTVLKAFRVIVPTSMPVQLAFAVPHEPTEADAERVGIIAAGAAGGGEDHGLRGLEILSFDQASSEPYDAAVVPNGSAAELIAQVGGIIVRMHDVTRKLEDSRRLIPIADDPTLNAGEPDVLRRRLAAFRGQSRHE